MSGHVGQFSLPDREKALLHAAASIARQLYDLRERAAREDRIGYPPQHPDNPQSEHHGAPQERGVLEAADLAAKVAVLREMARQEKAS